MKRAGTLAAIAAIAFGSILALAGADRKTASDPSGDSVEPGLDIVSATAKHGRKNKLIHSVKMDEALPDPLGEYRISLQMSTDGDRDCEREFHVYVDSALGRNPMVKCGVGETSRFGRLKMPNARTLQFTFKAKLIGNPSVYRWRMKVAECDNDGCFGTIDTLPDENVPEQERYVKHRLGN